VEVAAEFRAIASVAADLRQRATAAAAEIPPQDAADMPVAQAMLVYHLRQAELQAKAIAAFLEATCTSDPPSPSKEPAP